jgi:hypothetical protein
MNDDLLVEYYIKNQYVEVIQYINNYEISKLIEYLHDEQFASCISEIYLFSLLKNNKDIRFMHNNLNFQRVYSFFSLEKNYRKLYKYDTIINFGLHKLSSINDVVKNDPSYIFWCIESIPDFYVTPQIIMEIILTNNTLPLKTIELNILKSDCINKNYKRGYIKERLIIPWNLDIDPLKNIMNDSLSYINEHEGYLSECNDEDEYDTIYSSQCKEIDKFCFLSRILFLYHDYGNALYRCF